MTFMKMITFLALIPIIIFSLLQPVTQAQDHGGTTSNQPPILVIKAEDDAYQQGFYELLPHISTLPDPTGELTIEQVSSATFVTQFSQDNLEDRVTNMQSEVVWVRLTVESQLPEAETWFVNTFINNQVVDVYSPTQSGQFNLKRTGNFVPFYDRDIKKMLGGLAR